MKLNLGAGNKKIEGYLSVDRRRLTYTDILEDISTLDSIADESCSELIAQHVIEHFPHHKVPYILYNWRRILKPEGILLIETPNLLWIVNEFSKEYSTTKGDLSNRRKLINFLYGGQEYEGNYHDNIFDVDTLALALGNAGFEFKFISGDIGDQNIKVICRKKTIDLSVYREIWIDNKAKVFGDRLLSYPVSLVFKYYYPNQKVKLICNSQIEKDLFSVANGIDGIVDKEDIVLPHNNKDVFIVSESFDVDIKWQIRYGIKDNYDIWDRMIKNGLKAHIDLDNISGYGKNLELIIEKLSHFINEQSTSSTLVALFIDSYRPNMSLPYEISGWGFDNYYELCKLMPEQKFVAFYGPKDIPHPGFNLPNVIELGELNAIEQLYLSRYCSLLVSISTSVSAMIWPMSPNIKILVLNSQEISDKPVWAGIPDKCCLPPERYRYLFERGDSISFLKPINSRHKYMWNFNHYWSGVVKEREMCPVSDIKPVQVSNEIKNILNGSGAFELGLQPGSICNSCSLLNDMNICCYLSHRSNLSSGN